MGATQVRVLRPVEVKMSCDICKEGDYVYTGRNHFKYDARVYEHACEHCHDVTRFIHKYPIIVHCSKGSNADLEHINEQERIARDAEESKGCRETST